MVSNKFGMTDHFLYLNTGLVNYKWSYLKYITPTRHHPIAYYTSATNTGIDGTNFSCVLCGIYNIQHTFLWLLQEISRAQSRYMEWYLYLIVSTLQVDSDKFHTRHIPSRDQWTFKLGKKSITECKLPELLTPLPTTLLTQFTSKINTLSMKISNIHSVSEVKYTLFKRYKTACKVDASHWIPPDLI